jgi:hypothetical protein
MIDDLAQAQDLLEAGKPDLRSRTSLRRVDVAGILRAITEQDHSQRRILPDREE